MQIDRPWVGKQIRYGYGGATGEGAAWQAVTNEYYWDRVEAAYDVASQLGASFGGRILGLFRMVEGEALTRKVSKIVDLDEHLKFEWEPNHLDESPQVGHVIQQVCEAVSKRLGWNYEAVTLVTILTAEAEAPWHGARYGYCMDKFPYDKVCLPAASLSDPYRFSRVLAHEYAHVITINRTQNRAPQWVEEGISTHIEAPLSPDVRHRFRANPEIWRDPHALNNAFQMERRDGENSQAIHDAYDQSHLLVDALQAMKGDPGLQTFLGAYSDNSAWEELKIAASLDNPTDEALRQTYGLNQRQLFDRVKADL